MNMKNTNQINEEIKQEIDKNELLLGMIKINPNTISEIKNPTPEMVLVAVLYNPELIEYCPKSSITTQIIDVVLGYRPRLINKMDIPRKFREYILANFKDVLLFENEEMNLYAVNSNPEFINDIYNPSEGVIHTAINLNPAVIRFVENQSKYCDITKLEGRYINNITPFIITLLERLNNDRTRYNSDHEVKINISVLYDTLEEFGIVIEE